MLYTAFDVHKHYTWARVERPDGTVVREKRIAHEPGAFRQFLAGSEPGSPVAVEAIGNWYWVGDEVEAAGCTLQLVHAYKAKLMLGRVNKTDKLDAQGLVRLQRAGTLPVVWIPPRALRDMRELPRARMVLVAQRTRLKNRIHATFSKYGIPLPQVADCRQHRLPRRLGDADAVHRLHGDKRHRRGHRPLPDPPGQFLSRLWRQLLAVPHPGKPAEPRPGREDYGARGHRPGQWPAAHLVHTGDEARAAFPERPFSSKRGPVTHDLASMLGRPDCTVNVRSAIKYAY